jgi:hypothetical protein
MRGLRGWIALVLAWAALAGCGSIYLGPAGPDPAVVPLRCVPPRGQVSDMLVLLAQALPDAPAVPCLRAIPLDWTMQVFEVHDGGARVRLAYVPQPDQSVTLGLTARCDLDGAAETPTDQPGMRRYDRPRRDGSHYAEERFYVTPEVCTAFRFDLRGTGAASLAAEIWTNLGFVTREVLDRQLREHTGGRLRLDPDRQ